MPRKKASTEAEAAKAATQEPPAAYVACGKLDVDYSGLIALIALLPHAPEKKAPWPKAFLDAAVVPPEPTRGQFNTTDEFTNAHASWISACETDRVMQWPWYWALRSAKLGGKLLMNMANKQVKAAAQEPEADESTDDETTDDAG